jgi:hypothetical protein
MPSHDWPPVNDNGWSKTQKIIAATIVWIAFVIALVMFRRAGYLTVEFTSPIALLSGIVYGVYTMTRR